MLPRWERKSLRKKSHEPHDAVFKAFFSDAIIARNYLLHYTAEDIYGQIDFTVFQKIDTAFVSGRFGISFSDVLYESRLLSGAPARLLFLFEHKSYVPKWPIHLQLLDYFLQIWEDDLKNGRPLSFIVPIVVYPQKLAQYPYFWETILSEYPRRHTAANANAVHFKFQQYDRVPSERSQPAITARRARLDRCDS